jgi:hypothetical protein
VYNSKVEKGRFNISSVYLHFATYAIIDSHAYPSKSACPDADSASYRRCNVNSIVSPNVNRITYHKFVVQVL